MFHVPGFIDGRTDGNVACEQAPGSPNVFFPPSLGACSQANGNDLSTN